MALTQPQWYAKLVKFLPDWWTNSVPNAGALINGLAAVFSGTDEDLDDQFNATFITRSTVPVEDMLGAERGVTREASDTDATYAMRIQTITSATDYASIKALVDSLLIIGECTILQSPQDNPYCARGFFASRGAYMNDNSQNYFLILIPPQIHAPYSFCARDNFCARLDFVGSIDSSAQIWANIVAAVNRAKAFGVLYGILET